MIMNKTITIPNVDLSILYLQHGDLMDQIWDKPDSLLWGLVEMLDYVIDQYCPEPFQLEIPFVAIDNLF